MATGCRTTAIERRVGVRLAAGGWIVALIFCSGSARAEDWKHLFDHDGSQVFSREVAGSSVKEFRVIATIAAPADRLVTILYDIASHPQFLPPTEAVELVRTDASGPLFHIVLNPSWVSRRDHCLRHSLARLEGGAFRTEWHSTDDGCPAALRGVVRMPQNDGICLLTPLPDGLSTRVEYIAHHVPGGNIPAWLANASIPRTLPKVLRGLVQALSLPKYQSPSAEVLKLEAYAARPPEVH